MLHQAKPAENKEVSSLAKEAMVVQELTEKVLSLSQDDSTTVRIFLVSLLMTENTWERVQRTSLEKLSKNTKRAGLDAACAALAKQFYSLASRERSIEYLKTVLQNFPELIQKLCAPPVAPMPALQGLLTMVMVKNFKAIKDSQKFFTGYYASIYKRLLQLESLLSQEEIATVSPKRLREIYEFALQIFNEINANPADIQEFAIVTLAEVTRGIVNRAGQVMSASWPQLNEIYNYIQNFTLRKQSSLFSERDSKTPQKETCTPEQLFFLTVKTYQDKLTAGDFPGAERCAREAIDRYYVPGTPLENEREHFRGVFVGFGMMITLSTAREARKPNHAIYYKGLAAFSSPVLPDLFHWHSQVLQLLADISLGFRREVFTNILELSNLLSNMIMDLLDYYRYYLSQSTIQVSDLKNAQQAMQLFARFMSVTASINPDNESFTQPIARLLDIVFPQRPAITLFDFACLKYNELGERLKKYNTSSLPPQDLVAFFKQQDEALEPFLAQWEAEDKAQLENLKKETEQAKKHKKKQTRATAKPKESKLESSEKRDTSAPETDSLIDTASEQGKLFQIAGEHIRHQRYAEAEQGYQQAFEAAQKVDDHVIATASISELAESLIGQASKRLGQVKKALLRGDNSTAGECKESLATIVTLYQKAAAEAEKSLRYCAEKLPISKSLTDLQLKQVEHLTRSIKTVFDNASKKLQQTLDFIDKHQLKTTQRLDTLEKTRQRAKERLGPLWQANPNPKNRERALQLQAQFSQTACSEVKAQLEKIALGVLLPPLQELRLLHPSKAPVLLEVVRETNEEKAMVLSGSEVVSGSLDFLSRVKKMSLARASRLLSAEGLGQWTAGGNHGALASNAHKNIQAPATTLALAR